MRRREETKSDIIIIINTNLLIHAKQKLMRHRPSLALLFNNPERRNGERKRKEVHYYKLLAVAKMHPMHIKEEINNTLNAKED